MGAFTRLFGSSPRVAVVEAFAENPEDDLSVPEVVKITGVSKRAAYIHIRRLVSEGILTKSEKRGKCQYYKFNDVDPRGEALVFLENVLVLGDLESRIKRDEGISLEEPFPFPKRFHPRLVYGPAIIDIIPERIALQQRFKPVVEITRVPCWSFSLPFEAEARMGPRETGLDTYVSASTSAYQEPEEAGPRTLQIQTVETSLQTGGTA